MKKPKALPTHADEIDVLRLHNASLKYAEAISQAQAAAANADAARVEWERQLSSAEKKYGFKHPEEGVSFATREISRVKRGD